MCVLKEILPKGWSVTVGSIYRLILVNIFKDDEYSMFIALANY